jgi:molybdopterin/thiamine biosynthesis adenylyltransferase
MSIFFHEKLHRTAEVVERMHAFPVTICGAGALGANVAESLARAGFKRFTIVDNDRVEERNLSTQPYQRGDIGAFKARMMANMLYRAVEAQVEAQTQRLTDANVHKLLGGSTLVVDAFDNSVGRRVVKDWSSETGTPCLHAGLAADYAEIIWNDLYRVPSPAHDDMCDYPLARNLVMLAVSVACEVVVDFVATGAQRSYTVTLADFAVRPFF